MNQPLCRKNRLQLWRIVAIYGVFSLAWIYWSDQLLGRLVSSQELLMQISIYKGSLFVLVSAALLYLLISGYARRLDAAHRQLRGSEERIMAVFEGLSDAVFVHDAASGRVVEVNTTACEMYGCSRDELLTGDADAFSLGRPPYSSSEAYGLLRAAAAGQRQLFEWQARRKDGSLFWVEVNMRRIQLGEEGQILATVRDISARKTLEAHLKLVDFSLDHIADAVFWITADRRVVDVNRAACQLLGYREDDLVGQPLDLFEKSFVAGGWEEHWEDLRRNGSRRLESIHQARDGRLIPVELTANYFEYQGIGYNCAIVRDISDRQRAAERLRETEQLFTTAFRVSPDAININRLSDGLFLQINEGFTQNTGYTAEEVAGKTALDLGIWVEPRDREVLVERLEQRGEVTNFESRFRTKDGTDGIGLMSARTIEIDGEPCILSITRDITELRRLEQQNLRSAQLASIGQLAAGVAHEINNPINGVINYAQLLLNGTVTSKSTDEILQLIIKEADRVAEIVKELLFFSRDSKDQLTPTSIESLLQSVLTLTRTYIERHGIRIETELEPGLPTILVNPQKIEQLLINLLSNARYALDEKYPAAHPDKRLVLSARRVCEAGGDVCRLSVYDSGVGIPEPVLKQMARPFYTTKPAGQGTGLGLSICQEIVSQHRGQLRVSSVEGEYTEVIVDLPIRSVPERHAGRVAG